MMPGSPLRTWQKQVSTSQQSWHDPCTQGKIKAILALCTNAGKVCKRNDATLLLKGQFCLSHLTACDCSMLVPLKSQHAESSLIFYRLFRNASKNLTCLVNWLLGRHDVTLPRGLKIPGFERPLTIASESPWDAIVWFLGEVNFHQEKHAKNIKQQHHNPYMHPNWEQLSLIQTNRNFFF